MQPVVPPPARTGPAPESLSGPELARGAADLARLAAAVDALARCPGIDGPCARALTHALAASARELAVLAARADALAALGIRVARARSRA